MSYPVLYSYMSLEITRIEILYDYIDQCPVFISSRNLNLINSSLVLVLVLVLYLEPVHLLPFASFPLILSSLLISSLPRYRSFFPLSSVSLSLWFICRVSFHSFRIVPFVSQLCRSLCASFNWHLMYLLFILFPFTFLLCRFPIFHSDSSSWFHCCWSVLSHLHLVLCLGLCQLSLCQHHYVVLVVFSFLHRSDISYIHVTLPVYSSFSTPQSITSSTSLKINHLLVILIVIYPLRLKVSS